MFFSTEQQMKEVFGEDAEMRFLVIGWDSSGWLNVGLPPDKIKYDSYEEMCEKYKAPIRAVDLDYVYVCEFGE